MSESRRVVFDCNIFLQALANPDGPAGRCLQMAIAGRVMLYVSPIVLDEIAKVTRYPKLVAKLRMSRVSTLIENLKEFAVILQNVPEVWHYDRDPGDAHYINLALAADAELVVSRDRDLLDLMDLTKPEAADFQKRYPALRILNPLGFLREVVEEQK